MSQNTEDRILEERKVKALEKIANTLDGLTLWFEEIDKHGWDERLQFYLSEFLKTKTITDSKDE